MTYLFWQHEQFQVGWYESDTINVSYHTATGIWHELPDGSFVQLWYRLRNGQPMRTKFKWEHALWAMKMLQEAIGHDG